MLIMHIGHISRTQSFQENRHIIFHALVALKLLVSLISRLVACSARIVVDRQTNRQTHRPTTVTLAAHACRGLITLHIMLSGVHYQEHATPLFLYRVAAATITTEDNDLVTSANSSKEVLGRVLKLIE